MSNSLDANTKWSAAIEETRLTDKVLKTDGFSANLDAEPASVFASGAEEQYESVYPELEGLGLIKRTDENKAAMAVLESFCNSLLKNDDLDSFMAQGKVYSLVLFKYDLDQLRQKYGYKNKLFSDYVTGDPFASDDVFECPVRFYFINGKNNQASADGGNIEKLTWQGSYYRKHADVIIYLVKEDKSYKIDGITFGN